MPSGANGFWVDLGPTIVGKNKGLSPTNTTRIVIAFRPGTTDVIATAYPFHLPMDPASSPHHVWLKAHVFDQMSWHPERLGQKQLLFKAVYDRPDVALFVDPAQIVHPAEWPCPPGRYHLDVLMQALGLLASARTAFVFYATYDDGTFVVPHWEHRFSNTWWNPGVLGEFNSIHAEQGGPQYLVLCFPEENSAVIFTRDHGFEITFHGRPDLWTHLYQTLTEVAQISLPPTALRPWQG